METTTTQTELNPLVELTGSTKQVAWAEDLRVKAINCYKRTHEHLSWNAIIAAVNLVTSAKQWIENRNGNQAEELISEAFNTLDNNAAAALKI